MGHLMERDYTEDLGIDERIKLRCNLQEVKWRHGLK